MKKITIIWSTEDILALAKEMQIELNDQEADDIIDKMERYLDANIGINWDVIRSYIYEFEDERQYKRKKELAKYPFNEGDDYWTIDKDKAIWSCWDNVSEELHDINSSKKYFATELEAQNYLKNELTKLTNN